MNPKWNKDVRSFFNTPKVVSVAKLEIITVVQMFGE